MIHYIDMCFSLYIYYFADKYFNSADSLPSHEVGALTAATAP